MLRGQGDWLDEVRAKLRRRNRILFARNSPLFAELNEIIEHEHHKVVALWALDLASGTVAVLSRRYPDERRPWIALDTARAWAKGDVKMRAAQRAILDCHAFAGDIASPVDVALCHAVGQACGAVHAPGHAIGFPMYELTATVLSVGVNDCRAPVEGRVAEYLERIAYWREHYLDYSDRWAAFMER